MKPILKNSLLLQLLTITTLGYAEGYSCLGKNATGQVINLKFDVESATINLENKYGVTKKGK